MPVTLSSERVDQLRIQAEKQLRVNAHRMCQVEPKELLALLEELKEYRYARAQ